MRSSVAGLFSQRHLTVLVLSLFLLGLVACGGGGSSATNNGGTTAVANTNAALSEYNGNVSCAKNDGPPNWTANVVLGATTEQGVAGPVQTGEVLFPTWLPTYDKFIGLQNIVGPNNWAIYSTDCTAAGTKLVSTIPVSSLTAAEPTVSPDGQTIVFAGQEAITTPQYIAIQSINGGPITQLAYSRACTGSCLGMSTPHFSRDGQKILFDSVPPLPAPYMSQVFIMSRDGTGQTQLTTNGGQAPVWSADGSSIYYSDGIQCHKMDPLGNPDPAFVIASACSGPSAVSPDGNYVAYFSSATDETYFVNASSGTPTTLPPINGVATGWMW